MYICVIVFQFLYNIYAIYVEVNYILNCKKVVFNYIFIIYLYNVSEMYS